MRRAPVSVLLVLPIALAVVLALGGGATRAGAEEPIGASTNTEVGVHLQLRAGALVLQLENNADDDDDEITLIVSGDRRFVFYTVEGDVTRDGVEASFGRLGEVSLAFEPIKTISTREPGRRCKGEPFEALEGVYSGTLRFRGEQGYVEAEATRLRGEMQIAPVWTCTRRRAAPLAQPLVVRAARREAEVGVISALRDHKVGFAAVARRAPRESSTSFTAFTLESREGMRIFRYAIARARASTFSFDIERGTAAVRPPWPFQGSARFRREARGRNSWTGSLRVPFLGRDPVDLAAPGFRAVMKDEYNDE